MIYYKNFLSFARNGDLNEIILWNKKWFVFLKSKKKFLIVWYICGKLINSILVVIRMMKVKFINRS